jgi:hypothetical protein
MPKLVLTLRWQPPLDPDFWARLLEVFHNRAVVGDTKGDRWGRHAVEVSFTRKPSRRGTHAIGWNLIFPGTIELATATLRVDGVVWRLVPDRDGGTHDSRWSTSTTAYPPAVVAPAVIAPPKGRPEGA